MRAELGRASPFSSVVAANGHEISDEFRDERRAAGCRSSVMASVHADGRGDAEYLQDVWRAKQGTVTSKDRVKSLCREGLSWRGFWLRAVCPGSILSAPAGCPPDSTGGG